MITCGCGHQQASGRYCANCGADLFAPTTVRGEEPAPPPLAPSSPPPTAPEGESNARFPLYADEATTAVRPAAAVPAPIWEQPAAERPPERPSGRSRLVLVGVLTILLLAVVAGLGTWLLTRDTGSDDADPAPTPTSEVPTETQDTQPESPTTRSQSSDAPGPTGELAADATIIPPDTAPDGVDVAGNPVSFAATQMTDGDPATCWRMAGDGSEQTVAITLPDEAHLTEVGLINGYAKTDRENGQVVDWYERNRRITAVTWRFDDGTTVSQDLTDSRELQTLTVDVTTSTVELTIDSVTRPARGPAGRNYTAISELSLVAS